VAGQQPDTHLFKLQKYRVQDTKVKVTVVRELAGYECISPSEWLWEDNVKH